VAAALSAPGRPRVVAKGRPRRPLADIYVRLMELRWPQLLILFVSGFLSFNILFAALYALHPDSLGDSSNAGRATSFFDAFFFSVQTVATIGYGVLYPKTLYSNVLVTLEIIFGVIGFAMGNGLMFARFSRATARIMFSKIAVIVPHNGTRTLMFRAANQRHNLILEAQVKLSLSRSETSTEGRIMRRFRELPVERRENPIFILSWTVMHVINEASPLYDMTPEQLAESDLTIVVVMTGTDESFAQQVHARHTYSAKDIVWDRQFVDIISLTDDGKAQIDYERFHDAVEVDVI
jgi:inward rectifier potassium channel